VYVYVYVGRGNEKEKIENKGSVSTYMVTHIENDIRIAIDGRYW